MSDYKHTLNLPDTSFPMKGNMANREPQMLKNWAEKDLYGQIRTAKKGKGSAQALYSLFYYTGASLGVFFIAPFYERWGWQGVLASTSIALIICLALIALYQYKYTVQQKQISSSI